jgi:hypothetical protein
MIFKPSSRVNTGHSFVTSHVKVLPSLYVVCNRHTNKKTFFNQFEWVCLEKTAKTAEYSIKWRNKQRIVVDDVHLASPEVIESLTEMIVE